MAHFFRENFFSNRDTDLMPDSEMGQLSDSRLAYTQSVTVSVTSSVTSVTSSVTVSVTSTVTSITPSVSYLSRPYIYFFKGRNEQACTDC